MACIACNLETCYMCDGEVPTGQKCCCNGAFFEEPLIFSVKPSGQHNEPQVEKKPIGRPRLPPEEHIDAVRAGRDRARRAIKILPGTICQWAGLSAAGGGVRPIIGCTGLPAGARHHGPDKSTHDNTDGVNLHLICHKCHNRWHAWNDVFYDKQRPKYGEAYLPRPDAGFCHPHDPNSTATVDQQLENELYWGTPKAKRVLETQVIVEPIEEEVDLTNKNAGGIVQVEDEESGENDNNEKDVVQ